MSRRSESPGLKRRDIYAEASTRWRNLQARLLEDDAWTAVRADPDALLAGHAQAPDAAYRGAGGRLAVNTEVSIDDAGKIQLTERGERHRRRVAIACTWWQQSHRSPKVHNRLLRPLPAVDQPQAPPASGRPCAIGQHVDDYITRAHLGRAA